MIIADFIFGPLMVVLIGVAVIQALVVLMYFHRACSKLLSFGMEVLKVMKAQGQPFAIDFEEEVYTEDEFPEGFQKSHRCGGDAHSFPEVFYGRHHCSVGPHYKFPLPIKSCPHCGYDESKWKWSVTIVGPCPGCGKNLNLRSDPNCEGESAAIDCRKEGKKNDN